MGKTPLTPAQIAADIAVANMYSPAAILGGRWVALGDSITKGSDGDRARGLSWPMFAAMATDERLHLVRNAGVTGNTSAQMLARFDTDVTTFAPNMVTIAAGVNDINATVSLATYQANIAALVEKIREIHATPVLVTITPGSASYAPTIAAWNNWLRAYASTHGIRIVDFYDALVYPATGALQAIYDSGDHIHPNPLGQWTLGQRFAADMADSIPPASVPSLFDAADTSNILQALNPLWLSTAITNSAPASWNLINGGSLVSGTIVSGDTSIRGNWYRMTFAASALDVTLYHVGNVACTPGNVYAMTGRIRTALTASGGVYVQCSGVVGGAAYAISTGGTEPYLGRFWQKFTADGAVLNPQVYVKAATTGTVDIAELALFDLTALGIDTLV
jgi:lysophospholipase L1-like esterase